MTDDLERGLLDAIQAISVYKRGSQRGPHKPLLLLLSLASIQRGEERLTPWAEIEERLSRLLVDFGPPRRATHPQYPFWRLQNDGGFWEVPERPVIEARGGVSAAGDVSTTALKEVGARGGFTPEAYRLLRDDPALVDEIVARILEEHFPTSIHESLLDAVGMPWTARCRPAAERTPEFRHQLLRLYERRCAMCGFDGRLGTADLALEAAHIMWHALGGPDEPPNGLLLCVVHHRALDRGAVSVSEDHRILVSQDLHGGSRVEDVVISLSGESIRPPLDPSAAPAGRFIAWHQREVFRRPARP